MVNVRKYTIHGSYGVGFWGEVISHSQLLHLTVTIRYGVLMFLYLFVGSSVLRGKW